MIIANVRKLEHINLMVSAPFVIYMLIYCSKNPGIVFAYSWTATVCVCYRIDVIRYVCYMAIKLFYCFFMFHQKEHKNL